MACMHLQYATDDQEKKCVPITSAAEIHWKWFLFQEHHRGYLTIPATTQQQCPSSAPTECPMTTKRMHSVLSVIAGIIQPV